MNWWHLSPCLVSDIDSIATYLAVLASIGGMPSQHTTITRAAQRLMTPLGRLLQVRPRPSSHIRYTVRTSSLLRTMATTNKSSTAPNATAGSTTSSTPGEQTSQQVLPLPEPAPGSRAVELDVGSGQSVKLDHLGPMVVNRDGTLSRVANWEQMADIERQNTLRILGKRNQLRMAALRAEDEQKAA